MAVARSKLLVGVALVVVVLGAYLVRRWLVEREPLPAKLEAPVVKAIPDWDAVMHPPPPPPPPPPMPFPRLPARLMRWIAHEMLRKGDDHDACIMLGTYADRSSLPLLMAEVRGELPGDDCPPDHWEGALERASGMAFGTDVKRWEAWYRAQPESGRPIPPSPPWRLRDAWDGHAWRYALEVVRGDRPTGISITLTQEGQPVHAALWNEGRLVGEADLPPTTSRDGVLRLFTE